MPFGLQRSGKPAPMIVTGNQIRAARALLGWTRQDLARTSKLHPNAIAYWEGRSEIPTGGWRTPAACRRMHEALLEAGVDFLVLPAIGVRLVTTHNLCTRTRRRARARHGVIETPDPPKSQNSAKTLPSMPMPKALQPRCGAKTRTGTPCRRRSFANGRCRNHGGLSSGPKSSEGRQRVADAQKRRWERWRDGRSATANSEGSVRIGACLAYATAGKNEHAEATPTPIPGDRDQAGFESPDPQRRDDR